MKNSAAGSSATVPPGLHLWQVLALVILWNTGHKAARVLNTLYALELGARPLQAGFLIAAYALFPLLLAVPAGRISDRFGPRKPLLFGTTVVAMGVMLPAVAPSIELMFLAAALTGAGFIFVQVSVQSLIGSLASGEQRTKNINTYGLIISTTDLLGPVIAGFAIDHVGHMPTYFVAGSFNVLAVICLALLLRRLPLTGENKGGGGQRTLDLLRDPALRRILIAGAVVITGIDLFQLYMPIYGHGLGLSASAIGLILGSFAAANFVTRALIPLLIKRYSDRSILYGSLILSAASCALIPLFANAWLLGVVCFVLGLGMGIGQPLTVALTYNNSPAGRAGEALGLRIAINNSMHVVVPMAFGAVGSLIGVGPVFWVTAAFLGFASRASRLPAA